MTGFGRGEATYLGFRFVVEASSVNRRQLEIAVDAREPLSLLEPQIRQTVAGFVTRGRITVRASMQALDGRPATAVRVNMALARHCHRELTQLSRALRMPGPVTIEQLIRIPGVIETVHPELDPARLWPGLRKALAAALAGMCRMRRAEGAHLKSDLEKRLRKMRRVCSLIARRAPHVAEEYRARLMERIARAGLTLTNDDRDRLAREVVLYADRCDITEELTRLNSHFEQFQRALASEQPTGRTLDFICQEMARELNTLGAKANDARISEQVVFLKSELEKIREQVQNIE